MLHQLILQEMRVCRYNTSILSKRFVDMDDQQRRILKDLRAMSSSDAAQWLVRRKTELEKVQPLDREIGRLVRLLPHLNWQKSDHVLIAECFLSNLPHANSLAYTSLLQFMSVSTFLKGVIANLPIRKDGLELFRYYLVPALNAAIKSEKDKSEVAEFWTTFESAD